MSVIGIGVAARGAFSTARLLFAGRIAALLVGTAGPGVIPAVLAAAARVTTALERRAGRVAATEQEAGAELV